MWVLRAFIGRSNGTGFPHTARQGLWTRRATAIKRADTVGELKSAEVCGSYKPSSKAKQLGKLTQEKEVLER